MGFQPRWGRAGPRSRQTHGGRWVARHQLDLGLGFHGPASEWADAQPDPWQFGLDRARWGHKLPRSTALNGKEYEEEEEEESKDQAGPEAADVVRDERQWPELPCKGPPGARGAGGLIALEGCLMSAHEEEDWVCLSPRTLYKDVVLEDFVKRDVAKDTASEGSQDSARWMLVEDLSDDEEGNESEEGGLSFTEEEVEV